MTMHSLLWATEESPPELEAVGITEHLGEKISLDTPFTDEAGRPVVLGDFFRQGKPVVLTLVYYECPNLCTFLLNGLVDTLKEMAWVPGKEFTIVSVSINPDDNPELAEAKKKNYLESLAKPGADVGWHFLTGREPSIKKLADQVGFGYRYDEQQKQYAHAAGIFVLTPDGQVSRYLYGIFFSPRDVKLALLEAGKGKIGNLIDRFQMFCYHYDPQGKRYALFATRLMKGAAVTTLVLMGMFFVMARKRNMVF